MGNQGMKNWKFSMFFVIALTLVAGLFADTALAGRGAGKMTVAVTDDAGNNSNRLSENPLVWKAGGKTDIVFTFTADDATRGPTYMNGGMVKLKINKDWKIKLDHISSVKDGATDQLYLKDARLTEDDGLAPYNTSFTAVNPSPNPYEKISRIRGPALKDHKDRRRISLKTSDGYVTEIVVELDGSAWTADRGTGRTLTITLGDTGNAQSTTRPYAGVDVPIPSKLAYDADDFPYKTYDFEASTAAATNPDSYGVAGDDNPEILVGNIDQDDAVTVTQITSPVYTGDKPVDFKIKILANGPIYDVDMTGQIIDAKIKVDLSTVGTAFKELLKPKNYGDKITVTVGNNEVDFYLPVLNDYHLGLLTGSSTHTGDAAVKLTPSDAVGYVEASKSNGASLSLSLDDTDIVIDVDTMDKGEYITLTVNEVFPAAAAADIAVVTVASDNTDGDYSAEAEDTKAGEVLARGDGEFKVSYDVAQADADKGDTTDITYTAATQLQGAYLYVRLPDDGAATNPESALVKPDETALTLTKIKGEAGEVKKLRNDGKNDGVDEAEAAIFEEGKLIRWGPIYPKKGQIFKWQIKGVEITGTTGKYSWDTYIKLGTYSLNSGELQITAPTNPAVTDPSPQPLDLYVVEADANTTSPDVTFDISTATALPLSTLAAATAKTTRATSGFTSYDAAGRYRITFKFTLVRTPFKKGEVSFTLPTGWSAPNDKKGTPGYTVASQGKISFGGQTVTVSELTLDKGATFTVVYGENVDPPDGVGDNMVGAFVQPNAGDVKITSKFDVDGSGGIASQSSNTLSVRVENVVAGSGTATITPSKVEAGSITDLTVRFKGQGTMDGGRVTLQMPDNWGDLQNNDAKGDNYVEVTPSSVVDSFNTDDDMVRVNLSTFGKDSTVTIKLKNVIVQPSTLGVTAFIIKSAGTNGETPTLVVGQPPPPSAYTNAGTDESQLLGRVYQTICIDKVEDTTPTPDDYDGKLRVAITGGGDGGGFATVEIVASENSGDYEIDGATEKGIKQLHAGDGAKTHLRFVYTPIETIRNGALRLTVPDGWDPPQVTRSDLAGFTEISTRGTTSGPSVSDRALTLPISRITRDNPITIDYGVRGGGVTPPTTVGTETFIIEVKGTATGNFKEIPRLPKVHIRPQATGKGTATVAADTVGTDGNVYAGDTGRSFTITYTAVGQVVNGDLRITVPDKWSKAMTAHFDTISGGTATYGGDMTAAQRAADDPVDNYIDDDAKGERQLIVSGINLSAGETYTVTYKDVTVQSTKADGVAFGIEFRGNSGPGTGFVAVATPKDEDNAQKVPVLDVKPGSGTVAVKGPAVITSGSTGNDITITYTAAAQISADKQIKVTVPTGWSAPINDAAAADKMGTYTVKHMNADGSAKEDPYGDAIDGNITKLVPSGMMMIAQVSGGNVAAGEMIVFTYQNATAPATPGKSEFQVTFDSVVVESDADTVIVQSAAGVSKLGLEAKDEDGNAVDSFIIDSGGTLTVTVNLLADDNSVATRSTDTVVTPTSSSSTGSFNPATVTIKAGEYMGTTVYSDTTVASVTLNASTAVTGIADAAPLMVTADTSNVSITSVSVAPMYAKAGTTVTVTAMATPVQTATFSVGSIVTDMSMMESEPGGYTGSFDVVADQHADGVHTVTVSINGASGTGSLTIDNAAPTNVTASASVDTVSNGDMVTITATASDNNGVTSLMADVSALDSTQSMVDVSSGSAEVTISEANEASNGAKTVTVTAMDAAGNSASADVMITLQNTISYTSMLPAGISLFHVPLEEEGLDTVGDLEKKLGDSVNLLITYDGDGTKWESNSSSVPITADLGVIVALGAETTVTFEGRPWGGGSSMINLMAGSNLIGLPVNDARVTNISDIMGLFAAGTVSSIIVSSGGDFHLVTAAGDPADGPVSGDAAYLVMASAAGSVAVSGAGWMTNDTSAAPIALSGYAVDSQTPVLDVIGSVVDEITGVAKEGFRVKVKNLSTKSALSNVTSVETADGYNMTFVDLNDGYAARVGDVLEISAESPDPLIGVQPLRHIVTVDDVKNGVLQLEDLIAYEIPAETALLRNYPNPFNPETWIPYHLSEDADVKLTIYDVNGEMVRTIDVGHQTAAKYDSRSKAIYWDGRNRFGEQVASGVYFYHLDAGDFSGTRKMVILK